MRNFLIVISCVSVIFCVSMYVIACVYVCAYLCDFVYMCVCEIVHVCQCVCANPPSIGIVSESIAILACASL